MKIAVIGDVHLQWDERDVHALDAEGYDLALFVGDLAGYVFTVYALNVLSLQLSGAFTLTDATRAMQGHVLAQASLRVSYALYAAAR